jgi:hypothetical protein
MRAFAIAALIVFASPLAFLVLWANRELDQGRHKPNPASIVFTPRTGRQWLREENGRCIRAVLRDAQKPQEPPNGRDGGGAP